MSAAAVIADDGTVRAAIGATVTRAAIGATVRAAVTRAAIGATVRATVTRAAIGATVTATVTRAAIGATVTRAAIGATVTAAVHLVAAAHVFGVPIGAAVMHTGQAVSTAVAGSFGFRHSATPL